MVDIYTGETGGLYGVQSDNRPTTFRQKLDKKFKSSDFVRVKNISNKNFTWQALDPSDETYYMEPGPQKNTIRNLPKLYTMKPQEEMVIPGWNAQIMIEALYKKVKADDIISRKEKLSHQEAVKHNLGDLPINWGDNEQQDYYIKKIFLGIETPAFGPASVQSASKYPAAGPKEAEDIPSAQDLAKELGIDAEAHK